MTQPGDTDITGLLRAYSAGDRSSIDRLMPVIYEQLRSLARNHLRKERTDHTLVTTALVHEAFLKLVNINQVDWKDRAHFLAMASRAMRRLLIDYAKKRHAQKRGGKLERIELDSAALISDDQVESVLSLHEALQRLETLDPRKSQVLEHKYFGGLTNEETGEAMGISLATVKREMAFARAWLAKELKHP